MSHLSQDNLKVGSSKKSYTEKRQQEEISSLKAILAKLSDRLKETKVGLSQLQREKSERLGIEYEEPMDLVMESIKKADPEVEAELTT